MVVGCKVFVPRPNGTINVQFVHFEEKKIVPDIPGTETNGILPTDFNKEVKISTPFDAYEILKFLGSEKLEENQIKPYLYTQITSGPAQENPLLLACVRAEKIENHGR